MRLFHSSVKEDLVKNLGPWVGTKNQNVTADYKVAEIVRIALCNYENEKNDYERCYFKF